MKPEAASFLRPKVEDLGGFEARRVLPNKARQMVGPFIFFDHIGPATFQPGEGVDVRPHPHINLATVTYLFEGSLLHRDSLGHIQEIRPGAVNWMTAGRGISHSERTPESDRAQKSTLHGIQTWVALPEADEETEPSFSHYPADEMPGWEENGVAVKVIAGEVNGVRSPVKTFSPILYLDIQFSQYSQFKLGSWAKEQSVYSVTKGIALNGKNLEQHRMALISDGETALISGKEGARCIVIGGDPLGDRQKWWNFVSSRPERIESAKQDWREGKFGQVPEESEFIPLPKE